MLAGEVAGDFAVAVPAHAVGQDRRRAAHPPFFGRLRLPELQAILVIAPNRAGRREGGIGDLHAGWSPGRKRRSSSRPRAAWEGKEAKCIAKSVRRRPQAGQSRGRQRCIVPELELAVVLKCGTGGSPVCRGNPRLWPVIRPRYWAKRCVLPGNLRTLRSITFDRSTGRTSRHTATPRAGRPCYARLPTLAAYAFALVQYCAICVQRRLPPPRPLSGLEKPPLVYLPQSE